MVRMVNSGTEASLSAIRLARGATGRARIVKFEGCYHGHGDLFLVKAGSGALTFGVPTSPGVPKALAVLTPTLPYNVFDAATALFGEIGRASCRDRVCPVRVALGGSSIIKKKTQNRQTNTHQNRIM